MRGLSRLWSSVGATPMRFTLRAAISAIMLPVLASAAVAVPGPTYTDPVYHFSVIAPTGWERRPHPDALVIFMEPAPEKSRAASRSESHREFVARVQRQLNNKVIAHSGARANITVTIRKTDAATIADYAETTRKSAAGLRSYRILREN